MAVIVTLYRRF